MTDAYQLGQTIGDIAYQQSLIQQNISPDDPSSQFGLYASERLTAHAEVRIVKKVYDPTSFILDHPVQGYVDSPTLLIDGGYLAGSDSLILYVDNDSTFWVDNGGTTGYVDTTNTTATVDTTNFQVTF